VTTVLIVDDHAMVRAGLAALIDAAENLSVVGQARDGAEAVELARNVHPDVVLMDLSMPVMGGIEATRALLAESPESRVVVLTSFAEPAKVNEALAAGATGYLLKDCEPDQLLAGVRAAALGHAPIDPKVAKVLLPVPRSEGPHEMLSTRERQVLGLVARGLANKQIGRQLGISERTVKAHLGQVFRQLGVPDRTSAALWARDHLEPE